MDTEQPMVVNGLTLAATPTAVPLARALVRLSLSQWGFPDLVDDAGLLVSELATNAVQASSVLEVIRVHISLFTATTCIEVWDRSSGKPEPRPVDQADEGGRGLLLVEAMSADWGWYAREGRFGKVVWAELKLPHEPAYVVSTDTGDRRSAKISDRHRFAARRESLVSRSCPRSPPNCSGPSPPRRRTRYGPR